MRAPEPAIFRGTSALFTGGALLAVTVAAWIILLGQPAPTMAPGTLPGAVREAVAFVGMWGVMMAAMMLPSAAPMILLYGTVSARLRSSSERVIPPWVFGGVYAAVWLAAGVPVYLANLGVETFGRSSLAFRANSPYLIAAVLAAAGAYQFSPLKRSCLRVCESPLFFLMRGWRSGYASTLRLAFAHAAYCLGCCWALMVILVAAGAMSLSWVVVLTVLVFAEKILPSGERTARAAGIVLLVLSTAIAAKPSLISATRWSPGGQMTGMSR